jgi:hypothetical protein
MSAPLLPQDAALKQPLDQAGRRNSLTGIVTALQEATGRSMSVSPEVPDEQLFVASHSVASEEVMEKLASLLSSQNYVYHWTRIGKGSTPKYRLSRVAANETQRVAVAKQRLGRALANGPQFTPRPIDQFDANQSVPARYELLRSMPSGLRDRAISTALSGSQVNLPLSLFDRNTLITATGRVTVASGRDPATSTVTFSWQDIAAGNGYVALHRTQLPDGNFGLAISIRSGTPMGEAARSDGPSLDLVAYTEGWSGGHAGTGVPGAAGGNRTIGRSEARNTSEISNIKVSLRNDLPLSKRELPLSNVLKQLAVRANTAVIGYWPDTYELARERLPQS